MTEIHYYQCEYCGKKFEDEGECHLHEVQEGVDASKFRAYHNITGMVVPWPWTGSDYESINALWITDKVTWDFLDDYIQHELGYCSPMECVPTPEEWPVAVFNTDLGDTWINVKEAYKMAKDLKEKYLDNPVKI